MSSVEYDSRCYKIQLILHLSVHYLISNLIDASLLCKRVSNHPNEVNSSFATAALTGDLNMLLEMLYECFQTNISWSIQYLSRITGAWLYLFALRDGLPLQECLHALQAFSLQHFLGSRLDAL